MFILTGTAPWPPHDSNSTSAHEWAKAFCDAYPDARPQELGIGMWFLYALEAGYRAGRAHAEFPTP